MAQELREHTASDGTVVKYRAPNMIESQRLESLSMLQTREAGMSIRERKEFLDMQLEAARELGKEVIVEPIDPRAVEAVSNKDWGLFRDVGMKAIMWDVERQVAQKKS